MEGVGTGRLAAAPRQWWQQRVGWAVGPAAAPAWKLAGPGGVREGVQVHVGLLQMHVCGQQDGPSALQAVAVAAGLVVARILARRCLDKENYGTLQ